MIVCSIFILIFAFWIFISGKKESVRVGLKWLHQAQFAGMYVADVKKYYEEQGLEVSLIERNDIKTSTIKKVANGEFDIGVVSVGDALKSIGAGDKIKILATTFQIAPMAIVSLRSANISKPDDLRGKKLGIANGSEESKLPFYALLEEANIPANAITFKEVSYQQVDALLKKEVDAIVVYRTNELYKLEKEKIEYNILLPERFGVDLYDDILVTSEAYLEKNPKIIQKFLRATMQGWAYAIDHQDETLDIVFARDNPEYHDRERESFILKRTLELVRVYPKQTIGQMIPLQWTYIYNLFHNHGIIGTFNISDFFASPEVLQYIHYPRRD